MAFSLSSVTQHSQQQCLSHVFSSLFSTTSSYFRIISLRHPCLYRRAGVSVLCLSQSQVSVVNCRTNGKVVRLSLPSKGRMADDTLELLKDCGLNVSLFEDKSVVGFFVLWLSNLEVWFQRPKDIVQKLVSGDLDLGIVGFDTVSEHGQGNEDLIIVHDALEYGDCHLSLAIPKYGIFENVASIRDLAQMPQWTAERPLRVATGFSYLGAKFMEENGLKHVKFSIADGALEAAPAMGIADAVMDLVSSGTTLKENNLKEIEGGVVLESQEGIDPEERRPGCKAHLRAVGQFMVIANMRGSSAEGVAEKVRNQSSLSGLQGPTISPVFCDGKDSPDYYAIVIVVPKKTLYESVKQLRLIGGSGVLVFPPTYNFEEQTPRWRQLRTKLGL